MMASVIFAAAAVLLFAGMIAWMIRPRQCTGECASSAARWCK